LLDISQADLQSYASASTHNDKIEAIHLFITQQIGHGPTPSIKQLAHRYHVSESWLRHKHRQVYGYNLNLFIQRLKQEHAIKLLQDLHYSISDVAHLLAYPDVASFSNAFKKYYGVSPSQYRAGPLK